MREDLASHLAALAQSRPGDAKVRQFLAALQTLIRAAFTLGWADGEKLVAVSEHNDPAMVAMLVFISRSSNELRAAKKNELDDVFAELVLQGAE